MRSTRASTLLFTSIVLLTSIASLLAATASRVQASGTPVNLRCEYLTNPLGIDARQPRLSWRVDDPQRGARQTAYQVFVGTDSVSVSQGKGNEWAPAKLTSDKQLVTYAGKVLQPFTRYYWRVMTWDNNGKPATSQTASFETGMMEAKKWQGAWISDTRDVTLKPAPYFRKAFDAKKKVKSARAYIAVAGLYELSINGQKVGNHRLDPMYTRFDRRTLYVTYDVTNHLKSGKNAVGVLLGNGWYNHQSTAVWYFHEAPWRNRPTFCMDLRITYDDGTTETITSGKDWKTELSPVVFNSIYTAEHYDARLEQPGWNTADFDDSKWKEVMYRSAPSENVVAQAMHPVRNVETIPAKTIKKLDDTTYVFDLGRNISGVSQIRVKGPAGTTVRLKHGERLNKNGNGHVDQSNINEHYRPTDNSDPFQVDLLTLSGRDDVFMPRFNYKGFQYVEVTSDKPVTLTNESLTGYFMHSDVPTVGQVNSSNPTIDKIWWAANNSYLSNLFGYPTDCPQREKNGWTGDAHIASETGLYNFDAITIYEKWLADHRDEQQPNGVLPSIIPTDGWGYEWGNGPDWTSTIAIIPWNIYLFYGDAKLLADCYDNIKRYVDHINEQYPSGMTTWGLGDWVPVKSKSPVELTSTAHYFADVTILAKAAKVLGKQADYTYYMALAERIKKAFNDKYLNRQTALYNTGLQTELSVPLYWGLVPDELKRNVAANLAKRVAADNNHLDVGLLGTKAILSALSDNGQADVSYTLAAQETYPSWGWWIANGATTLYENWDIDAKHDISLNHIMFGAVGGWLYQGLGGIKPDLQQPGFKNVLLEPNFVKGLNQFAASHEGPYGTIRSSWKRSGNGIIYDVTIPSNSTATLMLANGQKAYENGKSLPATQNKYVLPAGTYQLEIR